MTPEEGLNFLAFEFKKCLIHADVSRNLFILEYKRLHPEATVEQLFEELRLRMAKRYKR
jgi:hypothetical protein